MRGVTRLPAVVRLLLLLALMGGIVTMHAVAITPGNSAHEAAPSMPAVAEHHATGGHHDSADTSCDDDGCVPTHAGMHGCVFVMTATVVISGLALLCWIGVGRVALTV